MSRKDAKKKKKGEMGGKARGTVESERSPYPAVLNTDEGHSGAIPRDTSAVVAGAMIQTAQAEGSFGLPPLQVLREECQPPGKVAVQMTLRLEQSGIEGGVPVGEIDGDVPATELRRDDIDENAI